mmetsp:Transcript_34263/g.25333  ORF Transcript_34263/g.25333 Transcript_34263/m.25333 type:complete len:138 (-) Transcript_34263:3552-3965(-)
MNSQEKLLLSITSENKPMASTWNLKSMPSSSSPFLSLATTIETSATTTTTVSAPANTLKVPLDAEFRIKAYTGEGEYMVTSSEDLLVTKADDGSESFLDDSTFIVRAGLVGSNTYTFESKSHPGYYFYHNGDQMEVG